jgi:phage tail sheath protein FI
MAIFTPSESPAIVTREIDLTGVVPNVQSTTGAFVGNFRWGPVEQTTLVGNEAELVSIFGAPTDETANDFLSAAYFLKYSSSLQVVRMVDSNGVNATDVSVGTQPVIKNLENFTAQEAALDSDNNIFIARYPGDLGNSLQISTCPVSTSDSAFDNWIYAGSFDAAPGTSTFASGVGASNDEMHVVVIDQDGLITGTRGSVLETYPYVSVASNAKNTDGTSNYIKDVINNRSNFIWMAGFGSSTFSSTAGTTATSGVNYQDASFDDVRTASLANGANSSALGTSEYLNGFDLFEDKDTITVDFLIAPGMTSRANQTTVVNDLVSTAQSLRKDCVVVTSPARTDVVNSNNPVGNAVTTANTFTNSSYLITDNNYLKVYDKYNDKYRFIPAASSTAGIMAATDLTAAPWFSPAGSRRGQYLGITSLSYTPTKLQRDTLYKAGINPIANIPGQGVLLFGDKTKLNRPSAFDRINVRRLFLVMERAIALAARSTLFEFNDEFTRAEFVNIVEPFLREIRGRRGITDFRVVCDETNNTPAVIDRNEFIASIFVKPARSINYITLNFVAVRTGVDFEEVVGIV